MENRFFLVIALFLIMTGIIGGYILVNISEKYVYNGNDNGTENGNDSKGNSTVNFAVIPCSIPTIVSVNIGSGVCITTDPQWQKK